MDEREQGLKTIVTVVYALQALGLLLPVVLPWIVGVVIDYVKREDARGTWLESHLRWQIRTFWWSLAWCVLGIVTAVVLVGVFILIGSGVWFVYRVVRGWIELNEGRPMYI